MAHRGGAPSKLNGHTIELAEEYVDGIPANALFETENYIISCEDNFKRGKVDVNLPTDFGLALFLNVSRSTLYEWAKVNPKFAALMERLSNKQAVQLINKSLSGHYKSQKTVGAMLSKHGIVEKTEVDNNNSNTDVEFVNDVPRPDDAS
jgi:hypothetical protein